ncbi:MAG: hypothetical protein ABI835_08870 [Chloroflexota bacterium]
MNDDERDLTPESDDLPKRAASYPLDDDTLISEIETSNVPPLPPVDDWMMGDIDVALAAVASLSEIMPEREAEAEARADAKKSAPTFVPAMQLPPLATLKRGRLGSLVPALLLIGLGAWLTLTTTAGTPPDPLLTAALVGGVIVVSLLAHWLGTGRWSRGLLFFALLALLVVGVIVFTMQPNAVEPKRAYPLLLVALGAAVGLAGLLARPFNPRLTLPGGLLVLAGAVGFTITLGLLPANLLTLAPPLAPAMLVVVLVLLLLPLVFRRRKTALRTED